MGIEAKAQVGVGVGIGRTCRFGMPFSMVILTNDPAVIDCAPFNGHTTVADQILYV